MRNYHEHPETLRLWFQDHNGNEHEIATCDTWERVHECIKGFIRDCNERKSEGTPPFVWHYTRIQMLEDGRTWLDVGSHTEFFIWEGNYEKDVING